MHLEDRRESLMQLLQALTPCRVPLSRDPGLKPDESWWFLAGLHAELYSFETCPDDCGRFRKWDRRGPDHFRTFEDADRHLFAKPGAPQSRLNREYIPHLAAVARAIIDFGHPRQHASFSRYRAFTRDLIIKCAGGSYETDAEFHDGAGNLRLQIEAKSDEEQTARLAEQVHSYRLTEMEPTHAKEVEYVLELAPEILWIVGPNSIHPARHVFAVEVAGLDATFTPVDERALWADHN